MEASTSPIYWLLDRLQLLYCLGLRPIRGDSHAERLESFYRPQAEIYDHSRKQLLAGREAMLSLAQSAAVKGTWVDFGCGTGASFFHDLKATLGFKRVIGVDLTPALLEIARRRAQHEGLGSIELVQCDARRFELEGTGADLITFSYALSMFPEWIGTLLHALSMLKPGGIVAVTDFYVSDRYPPAGLKRQRWVTRTFWPIWFGFDNIRLSSELLPFLVSNFELLYLSENSNPLPFMGGAAVPYFVFVGRKRAGGKLEPPMGFEPTTLALRKRCSTS